MDCGVYGYLVRPVQKIAMYSTAMYECLNWQNSQFINIVGKDDVSARFEVTGTEVA